MKSVLFIGCVLVALMSLSEYAHSESPAALVLIFVSCIGLVLNLQLGSDTVTETETD
jgi:Co/Zn/Cd efflux system component